MSLGILPVSRSATYPPMPTDTSGESHLLASFRAHSAYRIIPRAFDAMSADSSSSRTVRDMFEVESTRFLPVCTPNEHDESFTDDHGSYIMLYVH